MKNKINSISTLFQDVKLFEINSFNDNRGSFREVFNQVIVSIQDKIGLKFLHIKCGYDKETPRPPLDLVVRNKV